MSESAKFEPACPTCQRKITSPAANKHLPFCSERCRLVDLGRWLDERHAVPSPPNEEDEAATNDSVQVPLGWNDP